VKPTPHSVVRRPVDAIPGPAAALGPDGRVLAPNRPLADLLRTTRKQLVGARFDQLVAPETRDRFRRVLAAAARRTVSLQMTLRPRRGTEVQAQLALRRFSAGHPGTLLLIATDLTRHCALIQPSRGAAPRAAARVGAPPDAAEAPPPPTAEARLHGIVQLAMDAIVSVDEQQRVVLFNAAAEKMFRCPAVDALGQSLDRFIPPPARAKHPRHIQEFARHGVTSRAMGTLGELSALRANGEEFPIEASISQTDVGGQRLFTVILRDITERKRADERIQQLNRAVEQRNAELDAERQRWQRLVEGIADEVWVADAQGSTRLVNAAAASRGGTGEFPAAALPELLEEMEILNPDGQLRPPEQAPLLRSLRGEVVRGEEIMRQRRTGRIRYRQFSSAPLRDAQDRITGAVAILRDITAQKEAEEGLRHALGDKDTLLREVHHRTKNSLQMLGDLLYLQSDVLTSSKEKRALEDSFNRIFAIARLHEQLYQSLESGRVRLADYLESLAAGFRSVYRTAEIRLVTSAEPILLDVDRTIHVGLIVNELVTNALKHAFDGGRGVVTVRLRPAGEALELQVSDDGSGLPPGFDLQQTKSLGLRIVHILARRLQAAVDVESRDGTTFTIRFPLKAEE
jgi:PAS domain S-box-containing protein